MLLPRVVIVLDLYFPYRTVVDVLGKKDSCVHASWEFPVFNLMKTRIVHINSKFAVNGKRD